jgi:hypothetical protein
MAAGDWGSDKKLIPRLGRVTSNENFHGTTPAARQPQGEAPPLKLYPEPVYQKDPTDPDFKKQTARGTKRVRHGQ